MSTLLQDTIVRRFMELDLANQSRRERGEEEIAIMPGELAKELGTNDTTVRSTLKSRGLWTDAHRAAAKRETLRRINEGRKRGGYKSLKRQAEGGYQNLAKGRAKLAEVYAAARAAKAAEAGADA